MIPLTLLFVLSSLLSSGQDKPKVIKGVFDNSVDNSYFIVKFEENGTFKYKSKYCLTSCVFIGNYHLIGDTLILESTEDISPVQGTCSLLNERWLVIDQNTIFKGDTIKPKTIYVGGYFKRNTKKENEIL